MFRFPQRVSGNISNHSRQAYNSIYNTVSNGSYLHKKLLGSHTVQNSSIYSSINIQAPFKQPSNCCNTQNAFYRGTQSNPSPLAQSSLSRFNTTTSLQYRNISSYNQYMPSYTTQRRHIATTSRFRQASYINKQHTSQHIQPTHRAAPYSLLPQRYGAIYRYHPIIANSLRFANRDWTTYYFLPRARKMKNWITNRGLVRPGRKIRLPRKTRRVYKILWYVWRTTNKYYRWWRLVLTTFLLYLIAFYFIPLLLRWHYDITPRSITRFDVLDYKERWEHNIMGQIRQYRHHHMLMDLYGSTRTVSTLDGLTSPTRRPYTEGLMWYYFMLVIFPFHSGLGDIILYPRMLLFGMDPLLPDDVKNPEIPQNPLITMSTYNLLSFLSIIQTRMYLSSHFDKYNELHEPLGPYRVYDTHNNLAQYHLRVKRYKKNLPVLKNTYDMIVREIFRRLHTGVFYSGRRAVIPAPKFMMELPANDLSPSQVSYMHTNVYNMESSDIEYNDDVIHTPIPGLLDSLKHDKIDAPNSIYKISFWKREIYNTTREIVNLIYSIYDRLTWTGYKTGLENINSLNLPETAPTDVFRLHDYKRSHHPMLLMTLLKHVRHAQQFIYAMSTQFKNDIRLGRDVLENFQLPIFSLNSDIDEILYWMSQPEVNSHYTDMLRVLTEVEHSHDDSESYDPRRLNQGILRDRQYKLRQNVYMLSVIISTIQDDLDIARARALTDGTVLSEEQLGCEWTLYDLRVKHRDMQRLLRDIDLYITTDNASSIDYNIEPFKGDSNPISIGLSHIPLIGLPIKNILRRIGFIERGKLPTQNLNKEQYI